jgi:hypothetical protein
MGKTSGLGDINAVNHTDRMIVAVHSVVIKKLRFSRFSFYHPSNHTINSLLFIFTLTAAGMFRCWKSGVWINFACKNYIKETGKPELVNLPTCKGGQILSNQYADCENY